ncbi:hypothetical protein HDU91_003139 [Kappamyces sp. JEL0680]|nr:hypothetical protein HDU91_003139 [Kappamyces sp. JEL0680]
MFEVFGRIYQFLSYGNTRQLLPPGPAAQPAVLRVGILGCANIAPNAIIQPCSHLPTITIWGVAARQKEKAIKFAAKYKIPHVFASYDELLASPDIDVVYIPTPNGLHHQHCLQAIKHGKHILCEKPLVSNHAQAVAIQKALAELETPVVFAEAFHWKTHPAALFLGQVLRGELKDQGWDLGTVHKVSTSFHIPSFITWFVAPD